MKISLHKWLKNGVLCSIAGAALIFAGYLTNGRAYVAHANLNSLKWNARNDDFSNTITLPKTKLDAFQNLQVSLTDLNLQILPSENNSSYISWEVSSVNGEEPVSYNLKNGTLSITEAPPASHSYIHVDISFMTYLLCGKAISYPADTVYLYLSAQELDQVSIDNELGNFSADGLQVKTGTLSISDGDASLTNCQLSDITIENELGNLSITDSILDTCTIAMDDGDLKLTGNQYQNDITITNTLGNVTIKNPSDTLTDIGLHLTTGLGEIHLPEALSTNVSDDLTSYNQEGTGSTDLTINCKDGDIRLSE